MKYIEYILAKILFNDYYKEEFNLFYNKNQI